MAKSQSIAEKSGSLSAPAMMPIVFSAPPETVKARYVPPYVVFAHGKRADEWARIIAKYPNVREHDMFLIRPESVLHLNPAKLGLLRAKQFWAEGDAAGNITKVSWAERPHPYKEHIEAAVLVYLESEIVIANITFRSTKCPAGKTLNDALTMAGTPDWGTLSPDHKESLICNQPFMRFYGLVTVGEPRASRTSGMPYRPANAKIVPTGPSEWRLLKELCEGESTKKALDDAAARFQYRLDEIAKKVVT